MEFKILHLRLQLANLNLSNKPVKAVHLYVNLEKEYAEISEGSAYLDFKYRIPLYKEEVTGAVIMQLTEVETGYLYSTKLLTGDLYLSTLSLLSESKRLNYILSGEMEDTNK